MPTIRFFSSITGSRRRCLVSMMRAASSAFSLSRHQITPLVMISLAVSLEISLPLATPLTAISRSVTMPNQPVILADRKRANVMLQHFFRKRYGGGVYRRNPLDALVHHFLDFHRNSPLEKVSCRQIGRYWSAKYAASSMHICERIFYSITRCGICIDPDQIPKLYSGSYFTHGGILL